MCQRVTWRCLTQTTAFQKTSEEQAGVELFLGKPLLKRAKKTSQAVEHTGVTEIASESRVGDAGIFDREPAVHHEVSQQAVASSGQVVSTSSSRGGLAESPSVASRRMRVKTSSEPASPCTNVVVGASDTRVGGDGGDLAGAVPLEVMESWQEDLRRRFTPERIDAGKCLARIYNGGRGGQCTRSLT